MRIRTFLVLVALAMASTITVAVAAPRTTSTVSVVSGAIDATGKTDVTASLNLFLSRVPDGHTIVFPTNGRYRVEGTLTVANRHNLVIDGQGATFFATTNGLSHSPAGCNQRSSVCRNPNRTRAQWSFSNDTNIVVHDVHVIGSARSTGPNGVYDAALEAQHAFNIVGDNGFVLDRVTAQDVWGDLVYVGDADIDGTLIPSMNVTVQNSTFSGASRQGWTIVDGTHITFANNTVTSARRSLIDIEANTSKANIAYVTIRNNQLGTSRFCTLTNYGAPAVEHDFVIAGNRMLGDTSIKMCIKASPSARRSNYFITNNVGSTTTQKANNPMVSIAYVDHVVVTGNVQHFWSRTAWPWRGGTTGSPQAPVTAKCATITVANNQFMPRPANMPASIVKSC